MTSEVHENDHIMHMIGSMTLGSIAKTKLRPYPSQTFTSIYVYTIQKTCLGSMIEEKVFKYNSHQLAIPSCQVVVDNMELTVQLFT